MLKSLSIKTKLRVLVVVPIIAVLLVTLISAYFVNQISADLTRITYEEGFQSISLVQDSITAIQSSKNTMITLISIIDIIIITVTMVMAKIQIRAITGPLEKSVAMLEDMANGRLNRRLNLDQKDEVGVLGKSLDRFADVLQINMVETLERISEGDFNLVIQKADQQDEISLIMRTIVETLKALTNETAILSTATMNGELSTRGNADKFQGGYREIIIRVNATLDAVIDPLNMTAVYVNRISKGDIPEKITAEYKGDFNDIKNNLNTCIDAVNALVEDMTMLSGAVVEGNLGARAEASRYVGDFAKIVESVNQTLDEVIGSLNTAAGYIKLIGNGEIPEKITNEYKGDFNDIKNSINSCIDGLSGIVECNEILGKMVQNDYTTLIEGNYSGIYSTVVKSVNEVITIIRRVIVTFEKVADGDLSDLDYLKGKGAKSVNDRLTPAAQKMMENIKAMVDETNMLSCAAVEGQLSTRGEIEKFKGEYTKVIQGINATLDAVIEPINEASTVLQEMARGNLQVSMEGNYHGDHAAIKTAMNETIHNIKSYVSEISEVLAEISDGNLNLAITANYKGDFVEIKNSLNNIITSLSQVMGDIREAADQVAAGSRQVSDGSQALSQGSTEQASSIQELTASIAEIATQTKQNAVNANQANDLAGDAMSNAGQGNDQMKEMLKSMVGINDSSANISKIIKVIDDIAFQTNILALNAAVEAARAGQHGKGFAVVAEEVRNLAARSAAAARETTELIEDSISKVQIGTKIANETASALVEIVSGIEKAANLVGGIATASNEQASSIAQINKGIEQVSQVVQNNSATAEESAAASEQLSSQAELLKEMVGRFKLSRGGVKALPGIQELPESTTALMETNKNTASTIILGGDEYDKF